MKITNNKEGVNMQSQQIINEDILRIAEGLKDEIKLMEGKTFLITGGAGFLGYYLVHFLNYLNSLNCNVKIIIFDNFQRGYPEWLKKLKSSSDIDIINHDMTDKLPKDLPDVDYIIHAASIASPIFYRKHPIETIDANIIGLRSLLDYALERKNNDRPISSLLFFSSSEIYGDPDYENIPTSEEYRGNVSCTGPRASYDEAKRFGETLCINFSKQYDLPIKIARPFNNYGPGLKITDTRALPDFAKNILDGNDILLFSDGSPTRTFCYITDAIIGYYKVLINGVNGDYYNIGIDSPEISIKQLAEIAIENAKELFNYKGKLVYGESSDDDYLTDNPNRRCPDITKAKTVIGYNPKIHVNEGVKRTLIWYSDNYNERYEE